jgi:ketosteroid isomerase-like protein
LLSSVGPSNPGELPPFALLPLDAILEPEAGAQEPGHGSTDRKSITMASIMRRSITMPSTMRGSITMPSIMSVRIAGLGAVALLLTVGCGQPPSASLDAEWPLLLERQGDFLEAMASRDVDGIASLFTEGAVLHVVNLPPVEGRDAIVQFFGNLFGSLTASHAEVEETHMSAGADMAYSFGKTTNHFQRGEGIQSYGGKFALVWVKIEGEWVIVLHSVSSNQQEAAR